MATQCYKEKKFSPDSRRIIEQANTIIYSYMEQGYKLTLRQLYYQFVSRDLIPNNMRSYKRLGSILADARLAGCVDWDAIEDRTRNLEGNTFWHSPASIIRACADQFRNDLWTNQPYRVEIWVEKEALAGIFERVSRELYVPYFCCRGYTSISEMRDAAERLIRYWQDGQTPYILHFGDHDPSGIDMTRDIRDRMQLFGCELEVNRLALNMDQVREYSPPPNPAKQTDSRYAGYIREFGNESWELDALEPSVLAEIARNAIVAVRDPDKWSRALLRQKKQRELLRKTSDRWDEVEEMLTLESSEE